MLVYGNLMDEIIPNLWLGGHPNLKLLNANGIHSILTVMKDRLTKAPDVSGSFHCNKQRRANRHARQTFVRLQIPLDDSPYEDAFSHFSPGIAFIQRELELGRRVLVHCFAGISASLLSSPTLTLRLVLWRI
jgi:Dual specificity phosphatase, catalytic domain